MSKHRIYLAGGITGLSLEEHNGWRVKFQELMNDVDIHGKVLVFNPVNHIEELNPDRMNEQQAMDYDLNMLRKSDLVIVNFNCPSSIGTACELGIAYDKKIPIIGLNEQANEIHPWEANMVDKIFYYWSNMIAYFINHYYNEW